MVNLVDRRATGTAVDMLTGYVRDAFREGYEPRCPRSGIDAAPVTLSRDPRTRCRVSHDGSAEKGDTTMFTRIAIATAIVLGTVSGSVAMAKNTTRYDVFVNGKKVGADPDPTIRAQLAHDPSQGRD